MGTSLTSPLISTLEINQVKFHLMWLSLQIEYGSWEIIEEVAVILGSIEMIKTTDSFLYMKLWDEHSSYFGLCLEPRFLRDPRVWNAQIHKTAGSPGDVR